MADRSSSSVKVFFADKAKVLNELRDSDRLFRDRMPDFLPDGVSVPCDVFPYTTDEIEGLRRDNSPWIKHILEEVVWL